ncbi:MAG: hypothetical protein KIT84_05365 [Labilithrix sp.]|nr:hypothetical protein [Labilithrix sp.]MCW5810416.1 hypothetical protein [Labilithrix sp.]
MAKKDTLTYVETEGGPFVLLPLELKKAWKGAGDDDDDDDDESDYERAEAFVSTVGVLDVGKGKALVLGEAEVTAYRATKDGGVFIQRVFGDEDAAVIRAVDGALASGKWKDAKLELLVAKKGKLALFDSACAYEDADEDEILEVTLAPGRYAIKTARVKSKEVEAGLVRLVRLPK